MALSILSFMGSMILLEVELQETDDNCTCNILIIFEGIEGCHFKR